MSRCLPIAAVQAEPIPVDRAVDVFAASVEGIYLDEGTTRTTVRRSTFVNQRWAAIGSYRGVGNAFYGNDYEGIARGADEVTEQHLSSFGNGDK